jgi:hypothetical protein
LHIYKYIVPHLSIISLFYLLKFTVPEFISTVGEQKKSSGSCSLLTCIEDTPLDREVLMILENKIKRHKQVWRGVNVSLTYKPGLKKNSKICGYPSFSAIDHYLLWTDRQL